MGLVELVSVRAFVAFLRMGNGDGYRVFVFCGGGCGVAGVAWVWAAGLMEMEMEMGVETSGEDVYWVLGFGVVDGGFWVG